MLLVYKLLTGIIYFSEKDVLEALKEGVYKCICYEHVLEKQKSMGFGLSQHALSNIFREEIQKTCFIPLLDSDSPHESGNYVSRILVQKGIIPPSHSMFLNKLPDAFQSKTFNKLVIVDDCVGSGDQLRGFWEDAIVSTGFKNVYLKDLCNTYNIEVSYLTLFGYDRSISELKKDLVGLNICCVRKLSEIQRVFSDNSYIWKNTAERDEALSLFSSLTKENGILLYGYKDLDFAFIMHETIPDWSLPLFWKENADWKLLMRRKNSNA